MEKHEPTEAPDVITSDTDNATVVDPKEAPPHKQAKFRRLRAYNRGTWNGPKRENKEVVHHQDNLHRYDSIASSLSLTDYQKNRGRNFISSLDFRELGAEVDGFLFAICVLVANEDLDRSRYYPNESGPDDTLFEDVADSLGYDSATQVKYIEKVRRRIDL
jgi:hypothetical protein